MWTGGFWWTHLVGLFGVIFSTQSVWCRCGWNLVWSSENWKFFPVFSEGPGPPWTWGEERRRCWSWFLDFFFFFSSFFFFFFFYLGAIDPYFCKEKKTITEEWAPYVTQTFKSQTTYWTDLRPHTGLISDHILDWSQNYSTMMKARCPSLLRSCRVFWASCSRFRFWFNWSVWLWRDEMRTAAEVSTCCMNPASSTSRQRLRSPNSFLTTHFRTSDSFWLDRQTHCHLLLLQQLWQNQMVNWFKFTI